MIYITWSILHDLYYMIYIWSILYDIWMLVITRWYMHLWIFHDHRMHLRIVHSQWLRRNKKNGPPLGGSTPAPGDGGSASTSRESSSRTQLSIDHSPAVDCFISSSIHHLYPLVNIQKAIENGPVEIVDFPIRNGGSFHSYVGLPEDTIAG